MAREITNGIHQAVVTNKRVKLTNARVVPHKTVELVFRDNKYREKFLDVIFNRD